MRRSPLDVFLVFRRTVAGERGGIIGKFDHHIARATLAFRTFELAAADNEAPEGAPRSRNVVIEFPDYATALACYNSPEYQANIKIRQGHSIADIVIIEGYDGPQP